MYDIHVAPLPSPRCRGHARGRKFQQMSKCLQLYMSEVTCLISLGRRRICCSFHPNGDDTRFSILAHHIIYVYEVGPSTSILVDVKGLNNIYTIQSLYRNETNKIASQGVLIGNLRVLIGNQLVISDVHLMAHIKNSIFTIYVLQIYLFFICDMNFN